MKIRKNILPRRLIDTLCLLLIVIFLPIIFIFELYVVLPAFHENGSFWHTFTLITASILIFNIKGNMLAAIMIDTSIDLNTIQAPENAEVLGWRMCKICNKLGPPRSWHCKVCRVCILRRDHHCLFTACCIGLKNHRYFMLFVLYLFIGSTYAFVYNTLYLWILNAHMFRNWLSLLKMLCPMLMLVLGTKTENMYLLFYNLNILAVIFSVILLVYHWPMALKGNVCIDQRKSTNNYNIGIRKNLEIIFGKRMFLAFLSPLAKSELPCDGIKWPDYIKYIIEEKLQKVENIAAVKKFN